jgi:hypothetical protein
MGKILLNAFNMGGIADSKYTGIKNSWARLIGYSIHETPGLLKVNQAMAKDSGIIVDEFCKVSVDCSNGIRYHFSVTSGKVWQEKAGTYTLVYTTAPTANGAGCLGALEYHGYLYWATEKYLHRISLATADGASAWTTNAVPNWKTFTNGNATYHPMAEANLVLYIGDGKDIADVDANDSAGTDLGIGSEVFSASALDIPIQYKVTTLQKMGTDLLVGTIISTSIAHCEIFRWNTYSESFSSSDTVYEPGINCFLATDNFVIVNAGLVGNLYYYNGAQLQFYKKIPGDYSPTKQCIVNPNATDIFNGYLPIFGISNVIGNPCDEGIYSLFKYSLTTTTSINVLNLEWPISQVDADSYNIVSGVEIGFVLVSGNNVYQSWRRSTVVTITIASTAVVTYTTHGLTNGEAIIFSTTGALPTGLTAGTPYYIRSVDANSFNLYDTSAHAAAGGATGRVATSGTQSGVHTAMTVGVDKLDYSNKILKPIAETRLIVPLLGAFTTFNEFVATHEGSLPTNTSIVFKTSKNGAAFVTLDPAAVEDSDRNQVKGDASRADARTLQLRVEAVSSGNTSPSIQEIIVDVI